MNLRPRPSCRQGENEMDGLGFLDDQSESQPQKRADGGRRDYKTFLPSKDRWMIGHESRVTTFQ